ncbi:MULTISPECIES: YfbU family protein [unclassified Pseudomonas]|uniref:YfbU family protein n=1 Tax=unclassified Pseudomonas TaxID=196821 RepID=UPI00244C1848|nr:MULTISPECIES: YfbU family protein [unclassified Pseudomonas]MDG9926913.1 YfbU family protein [Pseudomonas sp. GD04042]MDH0484636.1 YfbU family protein [Pseudomonas sp. GD04015]MDH0602329.1 YfbU family protein [Pseudomonas sp. GD03869]
MEFSNAQKLIVTLLTDIHRALKIDDGVEPEFVQRMVAGGTGWALAWRYPGIFETPTDTPPEVDYVTDVLEMWQAIEAHYDELGDAEKRQLAEICPVFGKNPRFSGFDGNRETDLRAIVQILVNDLGYWDFLEGRDTNSHAPMVDVYSRLLEAFNSWLDEHSVFDPTLEEFAELLSAQTHPSNR